VLRVDPPGSVVISAGGFRTAASVALMTAVAIVLARAAGTKVADESSLLTEAPESDPGALLAVLRLEEGQDDLVHAAERWVPPRARFP